MQGFSQAHDVRIHGALVHRGAKSPQSLDQLCSGKNPVGPGQKKLQKAKFNGLEFQMDVFDLDSERVVTNMRIPKNLDFVLLVRHDAA